MTKRIDDLLQHGRTKLSVDDVLETVQELDPVSVVVVVKHWVGGVPHIATIPSQMSAKEQLRLLQFGVAAAKYDGVKYEGRPGVKKNTEEEVANAFA
jgi:hypothetical protein